MMTTHYPLSSPQLDIWFDQILYPNVPLYNTGGYARIEGPIDMAQFEKQCHIVPPKNQTYEERNTSQVVVNTTKNKPTRFG